MALSVETVNKALAQARGYAQYGIGIAMGVGIISAAQQKEAVDAIGEIATGLGQVIHGATSLWTIGVVAITPIVSVVLALWSNHSAKTSSQAAQVTAAVKDPNTNVSLDTKASILDATANLNVVATPTIEVTDKKLADAVPSPIVVPAKP